MTLRMPAVRQAEGVWHALGRRGAVALTVVGVLLIAEGTISHRYVFAWWSVGAGAIVAGAICAWQTRSGWPSQPAVKRLARRWIPFLVAVIVYFTAFAILNPQPFGDQPYYELESLGLAYEETRDMSLDYTLPSRIRLVFPYRPLAPQSYRYKRGGELLSVHNVGLPLLLALAVPWVTPHSAVSLDQHRWPWNVEIVLIAALAAQLLYRMMKRLRPEHPGLVAAVWASVVFSPPMVIYASQIYPEMPAVLLALIAVDALVKPPSQRTTLVGAVSCALLPWLHVRFLPIAALLALALAIRSLSAVVPEQRRSVVGARSTAWALMPLLLSLVVMGVAFQRWYGSALPNAPYRLPQTHLPESLSAVWRAVIGGFWGNQEGLLPVAPVCILALASVGYAARRYRAWTLFGVAVASIYMATIGIEGSYGAFSFGGRYELIVVPFAALALLIAVCDLAQLRPIFWAFALVTLYLTLAITFAPPLTVKRIGYRASTQFWSWFIHIWPTIIPSTGNRYPGAAQALAWTSVLLAASVAGYFVPALHRHLATANHGRRLE